MRKIKAFLLSLAGKGWLWGHEKFVKSFEMYDKDNPFPTLTDEQTIIESMDKFRQKYPMSEQEAWEDAEWNRILESSKQRAKQGLKSEVPEYIQKNLDALPQKMLDVFSEYRIAFYKHLDSSGLKDKDKVIEATRKAWDNLRNELEYNRAIQSGIIQEDNI